MTTRRWYFLLALVFALHNAEEAVAAHRLVELMQTRAPAFLRNLYAGIEAPDLRGGLMVLTAIGIVLALAASRAPNAPGAAYAMLVFAAVMAINALAHIALSVHFGAFMPGVFTAVLLTGPVATAVLLRARREGWITPAAYWAVFPVALLVHGPLLAAFIRWPLRFPGEP